MCVCIYIHGDFDIMGNLYAHNAHRTLFSLIQATGTGGSVEGQHFPNDIRNTVTYLLLVSRLSTGRFNTECKPTFTP